MFPLTGLRLMLPALLPSWRFFDAVTASPRVDYAVLTAAQDDAQDWHEFRPRPAVLSFGTMLARLFWNAGWNESLYLVSLAERLMKAASPESVEHSQRELLLRVGRDLYRRGLCDAGGFVQIRLRLVQRDGPVDPMSEQIAFLSGVCPLSALIVP